MRKNHDRKLAEKLFLEERGRISNKELSMKLGVHPASVARWKKMDGWDIKLVKEVSEPTRQHDPVTGTLYGEFRHLALLNEKIETYLQRRDLVSAEIRDLADAKFYILNCLEILYDKAGPETMEGRPYDDIPF